MIEAYQKGKYPLSMGVSLAFERLNGMGEQHEENPMSSEEKAILRGAEYIYVNVRTVYRSIHNSLTDGDEYVTPKEMAEYLREEIENLLILFDRMFEFNAKLVLYFPTYKSLPNYLPYARLKDQKSTKLQERRLKLEKDTYSEMDDETISHVLECDCEIPGVEGKSEVLMLTHYPIDLLSADNFFELHLLESNTGKIKGKNKWSQKLNKKPEEYRFLPFNRLTLTMFGDGNKLIKPHAPSPKKELLAIAKHYKWNALTTRERVKRTLKEEKQRRTAGADPLFAEELLKMV